VHLFAIEPISIDAAINTQKKLHLPLLLGGAKSVPRPWGGYLNLGLMLEKLGGVRSQIRTGLDPRIA
jgi:hypothetical protein